MALALLVPKEVLVRDNALCQLKVWAQRHAPKVDNYAVVHAVTDSFLKIAISIIVCEKIIKIVQYMLLLMLFNRFPYMNCAECAAHVCLLHACSSMRGSSVKDVMFGPQTLPAKVTVHVSASIRRPLARSGL